MNECTHHQNEDLLSQSRRKGDLFFQEFKNARQAQNLLNDAINEYIKAAERDSDPYLLAQIARCHALNGQYRKAGLYTDKALAKNPVDPTVLKNIFEVQADLAFRKGNLVESRQLLQKALGFEKPWRGAKLFSGLLCIDMAIASQKKTLVDKLATFGLFGLTLGFYFCAQPMNNLRPVMALSSVIVGSRFSSPEKMLDKLMAMYRQYPGLEHLAIEIGKCHMQLGQFSDAEFWFSQAVLRFPSNDEGYHYLAELHQTTQNMEELIELLERWLQVRPNAGELLLRLSVVLSNYTDRFEESLKLAQSALLKLKNPMQLAQAYAHVGNLYSYLQQPDAAIVAYQTAVHMAPDVLETYVSLGTLYYDKQDYVQSQLVFEQALALDPTHARILCNLGYLAWMQGHIEEAERYYELSIAQDPSYDIALNNLGVLYLDHLGNVPKAMSLFDQTLEHNPNYALCYYNKGRAYSFLGETIEAAQCFRRAQDLNETCQELDSRELTERIHSLFENHPEEIHNTDL